MKTLFISFAALIFVFFVGCQSSITDPVEQQLQNPLVTAEHVLDISMPHMDGIEAARQICELCSHTRIVMLTIYHSSEHVRHAIQAGASGYVLKDAAGQELVSAIRTLYGGGRYFSPRIEKLANEEKNQSGKNTLDH